MKHQDNY